MPASKRVNRSYSKQNRPVTACTECRRRKQKCDRESPCRNCVARALEHNCLYNGFIKSSNVSSAVNKCSEVGHVSYTSTVEDSDLSIQELSSLSAQIGYSLQNDDSTFTTLLHSLRGGESSQSSTPTLIHKVPSGKWLEAKQRFDELPSLDVLQKLVYVFFDEANWYFAILDQYYFDLMYVAWVRDLSPASNLDGAASVPFDLAYFGCLLFQVIAIALQFVPSGVLNDVSTYLKIDDSRQVDQLSKKFSDAGETVIKILGRESPTIEAVQADLMRCAWLKNCGRGTESWYSLSCAIRQAQELRLHLRVDQVDSVQHDIGKMLRGLWFQEHKTRLWAVLFTWESHMALQLGRPRMINILDCTVAPPIDCDLPIDPSRTLFVKTEINEKPSSYTLQLVKYNTAQIIHRMISTGATSNRLHDYEIIRSFHTEVLNLLEDLPPAMRARNNGASWEIIHPGLRRQRLQISLVINAVLMALHKPHAPTYDESRFSAIDAALQVLEVSQQLFETTQKHHYKIYTLVFYNIDAALFLLASVIKYPTPSLGYSRSHLVDALDRTVLRLSALEERNPSAAFAVRVLTRCLQDLSQSTGRGVGRVSDDRVAVHDPIDAGLEAAGVQLQNGNEVMDQLFDNEHLSRPVHAHASTDVWDSRDLFAEVTGVQAHTAEWLERQSVVSSLDTTDQDNDFIWDTLFE